MHNVAQRVIAVSAAAFLLAACQTDPYGRPTMGSMGSKETLGTVGGAVAGGLIGSTIGGGTGRTVAIVAGSLLGGALGNSIGASLDRADMSYYNRTSQYALENGRPGEALPWRNPRSGNSGTVTPGDYYETAGGYCREYTQTIRVGGRTEQGYGRACRQPDGTWQIVE